MASNFPSSLLYNSVFLFTNLKKVLHFFTGIERGMFVEQKHSILHFWKCQNVLVNDKYFLWMPFVKGCFTMTSQKRAREATQCFLCAHLKENILTFHNMYVWLSSDKIYDRNKASKLCLHFPDFLQQALIMHVMVTNVSHECFGNESYWHTVFRVFFK